MKPNFALTLSFEGIGLLHRAFPGWHLVGEIALDNSDLLGDLRMLRDKAIALDPSGVRSKLVIPNDQIKYVRFDIAGTAAEDLPGLVEKKLDGATPYALSDLVFDWAEDDGTVTVAAVARETLREAEAFAKEHQFNPISFVAIPENGDFTGEPFFGETAHARELAPEGEAVERDPVPVRIIGAAKLPDPPVAEEVSEPENDPGPVFEPVASRAADHAGFAEPTTVFEPQKPQEQEDQPETSEPETAAPPAPEPEASESEAATSAPEPAPEKPDVTTFTSIRAHRGSTPTSAPKLEGVARHFMPVPPSAEVVSESLPRDPDADLYAPDNAPRPEPEPQAAADRVRIPPAPPEFIPEAPTDHTAFTSRRVAPVMAASAAPYGQSPAEEQQRMTVFGARDSDAVGGKPKYLALILTAILLLFLAGVAVWASVFLDEDLASFFRDDSDLIIADVPALPENTTEDAQPDAQPEEIIASLSGPDDEIEGALRDKLSEPRPAELTEDEARARYAATGIWLVAPQIPQAPTAETLDDFYQTSIDSAVTIQDAVALPDMTTWLPDDRPQTPNSPASAGTTFALDDRGLVIASPQGTLSPDGILVYAGRPPVKPPAMPKREIVQEVLPPDDPAVQRLLAFRPKTRPDDLSEQNERDNLSGRTLNELARLRPRLRPQSAQELAEQNARQAAAQTTVQPFIDLDAVNSAVNEAVETSASFANAMPQAVASSLKPNTRPRNFDRIVQRSTTNEQAAVAVSASQRVTPRIPTTSSVAKRATQRNVLQMRKVNLIGVYGTPNSRRALVRLANGRYRKVKVGDRLDGGKVSAIGDSELRYRKSGRNVILKMPRG